MKTEIISKLEIAWSKEKKWRLGQLLFNLTGQYDCFHVLDEELNQALDNFLKKYDKNIQKRSSKR